MLFRSLDEPPKIPMFTGSREKRPSQALTQAVTEFAKATRHLWCVVSPPITKCTHGEHGNYDLTIVILWNDHYDLNFNVGMSDDSKK